MNKEAYLCLSAMLRARETRMLTADRAGRMLEASGFEESVKLLADCGYDDLSGLSAAGVDEALSERRAALFDELENLVPDKALVELFRLKYDYHNAKAVLKGEAMVEAASTLARTANPQLADFELDRACFREMQTIADELGNAFISGYVRLLIDAANLKSAVRTARMRKSADFLSSVLIKGGTDVDRVAAADGDGLAALFAHGPLEKAAAAGAEAAAGGSMTVFELLCDNALNEYLRSAKLISYGPEAVVAYIAAMESEITAVRMILTGSLAGVDAETIRERLRDLYA